MASLPKFFSKRNLWWITIAVLFAFFLPVMTQVVLKPIQVWDLPLVGKTVVIDPGHGGQDGGATSTDGVLEKDITLKISNILRDQLEQAGAYVVMTREKDEELSDPEVNKIGKRKAQDLSRRVKLIREVDADLVISIHLNAIPSPRWRGAQTFYYPNGEENKKLAESIQSELIRNLENTDRKAKEIEEVYLLKESPTTTALVEVGFLSNPEEAALLAKDRYQKKIASSIYYGILKYYTGAKQSDSP